MGLLDNLFKPKPDQPEEIAESEAASRSGGAAASPAGAAPPVFLAPQPVPAAVSPFAQATLSRAAPPVRTEARVQPAGKELVVLLGDILDRVPTSCLLAGMHDAQREVRFPQGELAADIARGRASVRLSRIAAQCPDVFRTDLGAGEDIEVRLPLEKLTEQLSRFADVAPLPPKPSIPSEPQIELSLAAVLKRVPTQLLKGERPQVASNARIAFPLPLIERQLASGRVEVSSAMFVSALPAEYTPHFTVREGVNVPLPPGEIFQNLPVSKPPVRKVEEVMRPDAGAELEEEEAAAVDKLENPAPAPPDPLSAASEMLRQAEQPTGESAPESSEESPATASFENPIISHELPVPLEAMPSNEKNDQQQNRQLDEKPAVAPADSESVPVVLRQLNGDVPDAPKLAPAGESSGVEEKLAAVSAAAPDLTALYTPIRRSVVLRPSPFAAAAPAVEPSPPEPVDEFAPGSRMSAPDAAVPPTPAEPEAAAPPVEEVRSSSAPGGPVQFAPPPIRPMAMPPPVIFAPVARDEVMTAAPSTLESNEEEQVQSAPPPAPAPLQPESTVVESSAPMQTADALPPVEELPLERSPEAPQELFAKLASIPAAEPLPEGAMRRDDPAADLPALAQSLTELAGVAGCVLFTPEILVSAGELPRGLTAARVRALGRQMAAAAEGAHDFAGALPPHLAIVGDTRALHFFFAEAAGIGAWLATRAFLPGVRERLHEAAALLARSSSA